MTEQEKPAAKALVVACCLAAATMGCHKSTAPTGTSPAPVAEDRLALHFEEVAVASGVDFEHDNGARGDWWMVEIMGAGAGAFDCDGDGDLDLLLRQGGSLPGAGASRGERLATDWLFRNETARDATGKQVWRFSDVTAGSGFDRPGYGMGLATGDFDNDGRTDVYLTNYGANRLLRGTGDCRFEDVTDGAGVAEARWSTAATFFDYDRDGELDLYVGNYLDLTPANRRNCYQAAGAPDYCGPDSHAAVPSRLFRNRGDGTFEDATVASGLALTFGKTLGAIAADFDGDGWIDLFVANDSTDNLLWRNRQDGTFEEQGQLDGCAVNAAGLRTGDMGVDAADFDDDGDFDLISTHLSVEGLSLWRNDGSVGFWDAATVTGAFAETLGLTGFGAVWFDPDRDGTLDLAITNGGVRFIDRLEGGSAERTLDQPELFLRRRGQRYEDASVASGISAAGSAVGRGLVVADFDDDGDPDLVITHNAGRALLLRTDSPVDDSWFGLRLLAEGGKRDALGAAVTVSRVGAPPLTRLVTTGGSYLSARDPRVLFGLRGATPGDELRVRWPSGRAETFRVPPLGRYSTLVEGSGSPAATAAP